MYAESADQAALVLPLIVMCFFFSRGMLVSAVFLRARGKSRVSSKELRGSKRNGQGVFATGLTSSREAAEHLASTMGFCGQMGALSANVGTQVEAGALKGPFGVEASTSWALHASGHHLRNCQLFPLRCDRVNAPAAVQSGFAWFTHGQDVWNTMATHDCLHCFQKNEQLELLAWFGL